MATHTSPSLSQPNPSIISSFSHAVTIKLTTYNFLLWKVQISAYLREQDLYCYVDGTLPYPPQFLPVVFDSPPKTNLDFLSWTRTNQLVLSVLFSSLSESVIGHVLSAITARELWLSLASMFASHSQAKEFRITNLSHSDQSIFDYFGKVKSLADILVATGNPFLDKEFVTYLLTGLGSANESFATSVTTRFESLSSHELYQLLLIHESRITHSSKNIFEPSVNYSASGGRDQCVRTFSRGGRQGRSRG
ncbi:hypothetical protein F2P56_010396 [Juglans regia]|uniref:Uncharacterized protein n=1 Tax=Juglans regia TaxID=51240 RepID=A0A833XR48_JUGRE|nr:hypothetical protein F2P56_010396 [Juglans regia]